VEVKGRESIPSSALANKLRGGGAARTAPSLFGEGEGVRQGRGGLIKKPGTYPLGKGGVMEPASSGQNSTEGEDYRQRGNH